MSLTLTELEASFATALRAGPIPASPKASQPETPEDRAQRFRFLATDTEALAARIRAAGAGHIARTLEAEANRLRVAARASEGRYNPVGPDAE